MVQKRPQAFLNHFFYDDKTPGGQPGVLSHTYGGLDRNKRKITFPCRKENRCLLAADGCKTGFQIGKDVINVLGADGQADGVLVDLLLG